MSWVGNPSLRLKSGSGRDDSNSEGPRFKLSHYPTWRCSSRMKANRVYLKYLTSKTKALLAPSRLRDREASFLCLRAALGNSVLARAGCDCSIKTFHRPARITGVIMSGVNGDKSRFNRMRKQKLARRIRNRQLLKNAVLPAKAAVAGSAKKPVVA